MPSFTAKYVKISFGVPTFVAFLTFLAALGPFLRSFLCWGRAGRCLRLIQDGSFIDEPQPTTEAQNTKHCEAKKSWSS